MDITKVVKEVVINAMYPVRHAQNVEMIIVLNVLLDISNNIIMNANNVNLDAQNAHLQQIAQHAYQDSVLQMVIAKNAMQDVINVMMEFVNVKSVAMAIIFLQAVVNMLNVHHAQSIVKHAILLLMDQSIAMNAMMDII